MDEYCDVNYPNAANTMRDRESHTEKKRERARQSIMCVMDAICCMQGVLPVCCYLFVSSTTTMALILGDLLILE
jgi:hypothetical protein